jgi:hypothetical protein
MNRSIKQPFTTVPIALALTISLISGTLAAANQGNAQISESHSQKIISEQTEPITEAAITEAIEEYVHAKYAGDSDTVRSRVHHDIARRAVTDTYWGQPSTDWVRPFGQDNLKFYGTSSNQTRMDNPESGRCEIQVFDIAERTASASVVMEDVVDYLHMIHFDGRWLIADSAVIILEAPGDSPPEITPAEDEGRQSRDYKAIENLSRDYCVGFYQTNGKKVQRTCHTGLSKRVVEHADNGDFDYLREITYEEIEILGNTFNKSFGFNPDTARVDIDIYEVRENIAAVKMTGAIWFDYFHLLKVNGKWQIVNIMFETLPRNQWEDA